MNRWWIYQKERFPIFQHGILVAAFSGCAVSFSALLTGTTPHWQAFAVAFITCFLFFLQLRIADEFKDADEDAEFRPYRAVPRGLVTLRELGIVFIIAALIQLTLALLYYPPLVLVLAIAWLYLALMSVEFFARNWLKARPITYLLSHMFIMPLVDFYATACQWMPALGSHHNPSRGLLAFLAASFCNGIVIEIGRKLRQPAAEEHGVQTYSSLWGLRKAAIVWLACMLLTAFFAILAAQQIHFALPVAITLSLSFLWAARLVIHYRRPPAKSFELAAGIWTLALYTSLGILPLIFS